MQRVPSSISNYWPEWEVALHSSVSSLRLLLFCSATAQPHAGMEHSPHGLSNKALRCLLRAPPGCALLASALETSSSGDLPIWNKSLSFGPESHNFKLCDDQSCSSSSNNNVGGGAFLSPNLSWVTLPALCHRLTCCSWAAQWLKGRRGAGTWVDGEQDYLPVHLAPF